MGWWWRATWPFGHLEATPDYVEISMLLGPTERLKRRDLGAVEVQRGALGSRIWLAPSSGRSSIWYSPMGSIDYLVWQLSMLGWPIRERAR